MSGWFPGKLEKVHRKLEMRKRSLRKLSEKLNIVYHMKLLNFRWEGPKEQTMKELLKWFGCWKQKDWELLQGLGCRKLGLW